jgi:hypothetical protein
MSASSPSWTYSLFEEARARLPVLQAGASFAEITQRIVKRMTVLCCHRSAIIGTGFVRPVYTVSVDRETFDLFFNSPNGYRAAYFRSPGLGLDANVSFMQAVSARLLEDRLSANSALSQQHLHESLITPSAKAWLAEHGKEVDRKCAGCKGEWSSGSGGPPEQAEILNARWELAPGQNAEWGRKAPYLTKLRLMGAFLNDRHHELVPHDKRFRAYSIHRYGWS